MKLLSCHRLKYHVSVIPRTNPLPTIRPHCTIQDTPPSRRSIDRMHLITIGMHRQVQTFHKVHAEKENYARKQKVIAYWRRHNRILFLSNSPKLLWFITEIWKFNRKLCKCILLQFHLFPLHNEPPLYSHYVTGPVHISGCPARCSIYSESHIFPLNSFTALLCPQHSTDDHQLVSLLGSSSGGRVLLTVRAGQCQIRVVITKQQRTTSASAESSD